MATYLVKVYFGNGHYVSFHTKNPKSIEIEDLRSSHCYGLLTIEKGTKGSHVSVRRDCNWNRIGFDTGLVSPFHNKIASERGWGFVYAVEIYHDYYGEPKESIKRLIIDRMDANGKTRICDLSGFDTPKKPNEIDDYSTIVQELYQKFPYLVEDHIDLSDSNRYEVILDGFSTERGIKYMIQRREGNKVYRIEPFYKAY